MFANDKKSNKDKSTAALTLARDEELNRGKQSAEETTTSAISDAPAVTATTATSTTAVPPTTTPTTTITERRKTENQDATDLDRLRSLLLGSSHHEQQEQVDAVYQSTQIGINDLRRDMEIRLDDLARYVGQLEQSIVNSIEVRAEESDQQQWALVAENTETQVQKHNERIDALDLRLTNTLSTLRTEFDTNREADRTYIKQELTEASARTDKLLENLSTRVETSIAAIEDRLSKQLSTQSAGLVADSATTVSNLRSQLGKLIDDRVRTFNDQQTSGLGQLRDILLSNTQQLNKEIKSQTEEQRKTLQNHQVGIEKQLNSAIQELNQSKVSHKDLAQLLGRLADRLKHL